MALKNVLGASPQTPILCSLRSRVHPTFWRLALPLILTFNIPKKTYGISTDQTILPREIETAFKVDLRQSLHKSMDSTGIGTSPFSAVCLVAKSDR